MLPETDETAVEPMPKKTDMHRLPTLLLLTALGFAPAQAQSLRGSLASMIRQNTVAHDHDFTFLRTSRDVHRFVEAGYLVRVWPTGSLEMGNVSFPYARPQTRTFLERLASQYHSACGEALVVTSLVRPRSMQPRNASSRSVHPTGMGIDLRVSHDRNCRSWLEKTLLSLEAQGVLDATRERRPPHYHVALFPSQYETYLAGILKQSKPLNEVRLAVREPAAGSEPDTARYQVRRGDSLWGLARRHNTTVDYIKQVNNLNTSRIYAGQVLELPAR